RTHKKPTDRRIIPKQLELDEVSDRLETHIFQTKAVDNLENLFENCTSRAEQWDTFKKDIWDEQNQPTPENELTLNWAKALWDRTSGSFPEELDTPSDSQIKVIKTNLLQCLKIAQRYYQPDSPLYLDDQQCQYLLGELAKPLDERVDQDRDFFYTPEERERVQEKFLNIKNSDQLQQYLRSPEPPAANDKVKLLA